MTAMTATTATPTDPLLLEATRKLLRSVADPQARRGEPAARRAATWQALEEHGLPRAWLPDAAGGAGASIADGFAILTLAGEVALDVPLAETLIAGWFAHAAGLAVPGGRLVPVDAGANVWLGDDGRLNGRCAGVAFAREADALVVQGARGRDDRIAAVVDRRACTLVPRDNLAGEPRDTVIFDGVAPVAWTPTSDDLGERISWFGAVARSCQMAGALQAILARSVAYSGERVAFDRTLSKFQAIQHSLARLAGETAIALAASGSAADALAADAPADNADGVFLEVASAKIRVGEAAAAGAAIAHQVHGAIGFSTEHPLHLFTRRLWAWRDDFGSESDWALRLGQAAVRWGADNLWPMIAAR